MRLALLGDIHASTRWPPPWRLFNKRVIGWANQWINPRRRFDLALLPIVLHRMRAENIQGVLASGDLSTLSLPDEYRRVTDILRTHTHGLFMRAVPGNHDRYTAAAVRHHLFEQAVGDLAPASYPQLEPLGGRWHLLTLDSTRPQFFNSTGQIGPTQLQAAERLLQSLAPDQGVVVLTHYPVFKPKHARVRPRHRLVDAPELLAMLHRAAARVVYVHGHIHHPWVHQTVAPPMGAQGGPILHINTGSPTQGSRSFPLGQGFAVLDLPADPADPITVTRHTPPRTNRSAQWQAEITTWTINSDGQGTDNP